jgi:hypothetical protein
MPQHRSAVACLALATLLVAAACGTQGSPSPSSPASPTPPGPTLVPTPQVSLPAFACDTTVEQPGSVPIAYMKGLEVANGDVAGRIVFTFAPSGNVAATPDVTVRPVTPPFTMDPSGLPLEVKGNRFLQVVLQGGTALDASYEPTFEGPFDVTLDGSPIVEVKRAGDVEAVSTFIVGLDGPACVRILPPDGTSRLVIEVRSE